MYCLLPVRLGWASKVSFSRGISSQTLPPLLISGWTLNVTEPAIRRAAPERACGSTVELLHFPAAPEALIGRPTALLVNHRRGAERVLQAQADVRLSNMVRRVDVHGQTLCDIDLLGAVDVLSRRRCRSEADASDDTTIL